MNQPSTYFKWAFQQLQHHKLTAGVTVGFSALAAAAAFSDDALSLWSRIVGDPEQVKFQYEFIHRMTGDSTDIQGIVVNDGRAPLYIASVLLHLDDGKASSGKVLRASDELSPIQPGAARHYVFTVSRKELLAWCDSKRAWFTVASNRSELHVSADIMEIMRSNSFLQHPLEMSRASTEPIDRRRR